MKDTMMTGWEKKRTWVNTTVKPRGLSFGILLDDEFLQTPKKNKVLLPTRELAQKVAKEWRRQKEIIDPTKMPYTRLANSALDTVKESFDTVVADVLDYGDTDLVCYRADSPEDLVKLQNKHWDPILDWAKNQFKIEVKITNGINYKAQDPVQLRKLSREISSYNFFTLTGFYDLVTISGSLLIALAVYYSHVSLKRGFDISFLDEDWQRKKWGQDEESIKNRVNKFREFQIACRFLKCLK